jgi:hypothetical protein
VRELDRAEAPGLGADRLLREARVREPAALGELVEQALDILPLLRAGLQLSLELDTGVLAAREESHGPDLQGRLWFGHTVKAQATLFRCEET